MKLRDVKVGERYHANGQGHRALVAESIEKADRKNGIWNSSIICRDEESGNQARYWPSDLTSWDDYLTAKRMDEIGVAETMAHVQIIQKAAGKGVKVVGTPLSNFVVLQFTEPAADATLKALGAKALPDDRRPSLAADPYDTEGYERLCVLLGQRLRRAFGAGYAGEWLSSKLKRPYAAELYFYNGSVAEAASKISGKPTEVNSALSELIG